MHIMDKKVRGITDNSKKVKKDFVFVLIKEKNTDINKSIDEAIENGAFIIYSENHIDNKSIPIIKVENSRKKLIKLLNEFYDYPMKNLSIIGVAGTNKNNTTISLIKSIFKKSNIKIETINSLDGNYKNKNLHEIFYELNKSDIQVIIIEITSENLEFFNKYNIEFDVAIYTNMNIKGDNDERNLEEYLNHKMFFDSLEKDKLAIINTDDKNSINVLEGNNKVLTISYGLNSKASITASSIKMDEKMNFTICIQRSIYSFKEVEYEPQEFNISISSLDLYNIYDILAAISCALYFGIDIDLIKYALK